MWTCRAPLQPRGIKRGVVVGACVLGHALRKRDAQDPHRPHPHPHRQQKLEPLGWRGGVWGGGEGRGGQG